MTMSENSETLVTPIAHTEGMGWFDSKVCYRALQARDRRFDGYLFVGVTSTGIYCRPICPAKTAKFENCRFFRTAAAAQEAGFRPCLRCRPEISPETAGWRGTANSVSRALALIAEGFFDDDNTSIGMLAERVGIGERQLRRLFDEHLGASPLSVAQTRRVLFAKQLLHETDLSMTDVAMASGFGSVRRFNDTFHKLYRRSPSELRRRRQTDDSTLSLPPGITLHVAYRPPYDWNSFLAYLSARTIEGVEEITDGRYRRTFSYEGREGIVEVANNPRRQGLSVNIQFPSVAALSAVVLRVRRMFDVHADVNSIEAHLSGDRALARLIAQRPGLRTPGGWDGFELAVRGILSQQISVQAARRFIGKLVRLCCQPSATLPIGNLTYVFPSAHRLASADLSALGIPKARRNTLKALAEIVQANPRVFESSSSFDEVIARLRAIPGVGEWTVQYLALRAFRETDAFPATDIAILRGAIELAGTATTAIQLINRAEMWRPWRAYAAQHLWAAGAAAAANRNGRSHG
jgi:AraC family transcriptional regulator of adaptative response / DNA-3-methyladenine glycosylase II